MNIIYTANVRMPTEKAHGVQIMKTCEALANAGNNVTLVVPRRRNPLGDKDPFDFYSIKTRFKIAYVPTLDLVSLGKFGFWIQLATYAEFAFWYVLFHKADYIYSREVLSSSYLSLIKKNILFEFHTNDFNFLVKRLLRKCFRIVVITEGLKEFYVGKGVPEEKIVVVPDALDDRLFNISSSKNDSRNKLNLPGDKKIVMYIGHLYGWKGADSLAKAAEYFGEDVLTVFVGGTATDIERFQKEYTSKNIQIVGHRPHDEVPYWQKAADVLVLPNTATVEISRLYTSPAKLFEYMASERPIVASNIPSLSEILNDSNATLVEPDNPQALADGILWVFEHEPEAEEKAKQAAVDVLEYTWDKRAERIISSLNI